MKLYLVIFFLLPITLIAQPEFSFDLYFEDALGNKDTITLGYDPLATDGIDSVFGEENIISQPWDSVFEVRIGIGSFLVNSVYPVFVPNKQSKRQISKPYCESSYYNAYNYTLQLKNAVFPISIYWTKSLFENVCTTSNFITDWFPGCWFDCNITGNEQLPWSFSSIDSIYLNYTSLENINNNDTTNLLFVSLSNGSVGLNKIYFENNQIDIYPNPSESYTSMKWELPDNLVNCQYIINDLNGSEIIRSSISKNKGEMVIDTRNFNSGVYIISIVNNGVKIQERKLIVKNK